MTPDRTEGHSFICPYCDRPATALWCGTAEWSGRDLQGNPSNPPAEWALVQCDRCEQPSLEVREDFGDGFADDQAVIVYPTTHRLSADIPLGLRREYAEAQACWNAKAYTACVVMVRRTLEGTCAEQGVSKRPLVKALRELRAQDLIDGTLADWADTLRTLGNIGAHYTASTVTRQDAEDALAFAEALLDHIYVLRKRFAEFKERVGH